MNKINKISTLLIAVSLVLVLFLSGCGKEAESNKVLATVNGLEITESQFNQRYNIIAGQYDLDPENQDHAAYAADLKEQVLNSLVDETVLLQEAEAQGLIATEEEVNKEIETFKANFSSTEEFETYLSSYLKLTEEEMKAVLLNDLTIANVFDQVTKDVDSSQMSPEEYYENNKAMFMNPEQVSATHILLESQEEAKEIIEEIKAGGDMNQIAAEKSIDESAKMNNGDLGFFSKGRMVEEFDQAVFSMEVGQLLEEPVKTNFGYHVIRLNDKKAAEEIKFTEVEEDIKSYLIEEQKNNAFVEYINELRATSEIEMS